VERLKDPEYAAGYLLACIKEGGDVFLLGVKDVIEAAKRNSDEKPKD
jgi:DNA-binding phage protein